MPGGFFCLSPENANRPKPPQTPNFPENPALPRNPPGIPTEFILSATQNPPLNSPEFSRNSRISRKIAQIPPNPRNFREIRGGEEFTQSASFGVQKPPFPFVLEKRVFCQKICGPLKKKGVFLTENSLFQDGRNGGFWTPKPSFLGNRDSGPYLGSAESGKTKGGGPAVKRRRVLRKAKRPFGAVTGMHWTGLPNRSTLTK